MKKYLVLFSGWDMANNRIFSTREKAKNFIVNQFEKFLDYGDGYYRRDYRKLWGEIAERYQEDFDQNSGIEDFAHLVEIEEDNMEDIDWGES